MTKIGQVRMNVVQQFFDTFGGAPERVAITEPGGRTITYEQLHRRVVGVARQLREQGLRPGQNVVVVFPNGIELVAVILAILADGAIPVLCEPGLGDAVYLSRVRAAQARWLVVHPLVRWINRIPNAREILSRWEIEIPPLLEKECKVLALGPRDLAALADQEDSADKFQICSKKASDEALLIFTGGTTAQPKGVRMSHGSLDHFLHQVTSVVQDLKMNHCLADTPQQALMGLRLGLSVHTSKGRKSRRARDLYRLIQEGIIDSYFGSPFVWTQLMDQHPQGFRAVRTLKSVLLGSAPVSLQFLERLRGYLPPATHVLSVYGLTEAGPVCIVDVDDKLAWKGEGDLVGEPIHGVSIRIDVPMEKDIGEILVWSRSLYTGYLGQPGRSSKEYLHTGDLGRWVHVRRRKMLVLMGRKKEMIIRRGVNIYPGVLEPSAKLLQDSQGLIVEDCAFVGIWNSDKQDEELVFCYQNASNRQPIDEKILRERLSMVVGPEGKPDHLMRVERLPVRGRQNKIDRIQLRQLAENRFSPAGSERSRGQKKNNFQATERVSPEVWSHLPGAIIPFGWDYFIDKYTNLVRREGITANLAGQVAIRLWLLSLGQVSWVLDEVLFPAWRNTHQRGPLFILGHQRSGTTFLHRLLSQDTDHARALSLQEMLLPAISFQSALKWIQRGDALLGAPASKKLQNLQDRLFGPMDDIHRIRFNEIEEDEFVLWGIFRSIMCANDAPTTVEFRDLDELRHFHSWPTQEQALALGWYRACLMKKIYRDPVAPEGGSAWIISKNPAFTHKIPELMKVFSDARFIYLIRNPLETIPSRLSMLREIWRRRFPSFEDVNSNHIETVLQDSFTNYLAAERDLPALPADRYLTVPYSKLMQSPDGVVQDIYRQFSLPGPGAKLLEELNRLKRRKRRHQTRHSYDLKEFSLDEHRIRRELKPVFDKYGF